MGLRTEALGYLRAIVESGSLQAAARNELIAPSAVSRHIKQLEREAGAELFVRTARGMTPTRAGMLLYEFAERASEEEEALKRRIREGGTQLTGDLHVACVEGVLPHYLPAWTERVRTKFPHVRLHIDAMASVDVASAVACGAADVGYVFGRVDRTELRKLGSLSMPIGLLLPSRHHLAKQPHVDFEQLSEMTFILPNHSFGIRREVDRAAAVAGVELEVALETNSLQFAAQIVRRQGLATFSTEAMVAPLLDEGGLAIVPIANELLRSTEIELVTHTLDGSPLAQAVRGQLAKALDEIG